MNIAPYRSIGDQVSQTLAPVVRLRLNKRADENLYDRQLADTQAANQAATGRIQLQTGLERQNKIDEETRKQAQTNSDIQGLSGHLVKMGFDPEKALTVATAHYSGDHQTLNDILNPPYHAPTKTADQIAAESTADVNWRNAEAAKAGNPVEKVPKPTGDTLIDFNGSPQPISAILKKREDLNDEGDYQSGNNVVPKPGSIREAQANLDAENAKHETWGGLGGGRPNAAKVASLTAELNRRKSQAAKYDEALKPFVGAKGQTVQPAGGGATGEINTDEEFLKKWGKK